MFPTIFALDAIAAVGVYETLEGEFVKVASAPFIAYGIYKLGQCCRSAIVSEFGEAMILASAMTLPSCAVGWALYTLGGKTLAAKAVACIGGAVYTHYLTDNFIGWCSRIILKFAPH